MQTFWGRLSRGAKLGLAAGVGVIVAMSVWIGVALLQPQYQVLFSRLSDADAAVIVEQLKHQKLPYRIGEDGTTIEVPAEQVHETRLRLMSTGVPLSGVVGFEIFDKQGLGTTEESQRVSYQRALQGELARTIGALEDVKQARVHLVLPESTLFKRDRQEARAAVSLTLRPSAVLSREQITGIQRLVAASVAGLDAAKVVITDQRGITLSGSDAAGAGATEGRLEMKREIEDYVTRKVARLLDSTYGPGQAIVSVDVLLNFDEIHRTIQNLLPVQGQGPADSHGGWIRRKHQVVAGSASAPDVESPDKALRASPATSSTTDEEYEYGRSMEQVISAPGSITRLSVGVIVPGDIGLEKQKRIMDLVRMAAGVNEARGDAIVVQALDQLGARSPAQEVAADDRGPSGTTPKVTTPPARVSRESHSVSGWWSPQWVLLSAILIAIVLLLLVLLRRRFAAGQEPGRLLPLSPQERETLLLEMQMTLAEGVALAEARGRS